MTNHKLQTATEDLGYDNEPCFSDSQKTVILDPKVFENRRSDLTGALPRKRVRKRKLLTDQKTSQQAPEVVADPTMDFTSQGMPLLSPSTQPIVDPRRMGKNLSDVSEDDASNIICILIPNSIAAYEACEATMQVAPQHILQNTDLEEISDDFTEGRLNKGKVQRDIALRMSSDVKRPKFGFSFGRSSAYSDILLTPNENDLKVSQLHFKIFVNGQGSLMIQDHSTNGTMVDDRHLKGKINGAPTRTPATQALKSGAILSIINDGNAEIKFMVRIPTRGDHDERYEKRLREYLAARGITSEFGSIRESSLGNHWNGGSKYNFTGLLGKGAFATVYRVQTKSEGTYLAAKEIDKRKFIKNGVLDLKVENELKIMQGLRHPHIVEYRDHEDWQHWIYIIMEHVPHGDLAAELNRAGRITEDVMQQVTQQLLHALNYLHRRGITHRDIKPDNILIASQDPVIVKLSDFGLSKCVKNQETFLKTFCGTLLYCAPEVYPDYANYDRGLRKRPRRGEKHTKSSPYDQSVDMWSLAAVVFHMLCGQAPVDTRDEPRGGEKGAQMLNSIMTRDLSFEPLRSWGISANAINFLSLLLKRDPRERPDAATCLSHPWVRDVVSLFDYVFENKDFINFRGELEALEEESIGEYMDEEDYEQRESEADTSEAVLEMKRLMARHEVQTGAGFPSPATKRPKLTSKAEADMEAERLYPVLPALGATDPLVGPAPGGQRLYGEITPSVLKSSGIFGGAAANPLGVPGIQRGVEQISVDDIGSNYSIQQANDPSNQAPPQRQIQNLQRLSGAAPSLMGAEAQIGLMNMASPEATILQASPTILMTTGPERDPALTIDAKMSDKENRGLGLDNLLPHPKISRRVDLDLLEDDEAWGAEMRAREASRALRRLEKAATFQTTAGLTGWGKSVELAKTIDAQTGREVQSETIPPATSISTNHRTGHTDRSGINTGTSTKSNSSGSEGSKKKIRLGKLTTLPGSFDDITIHLAGRMNSWGRADDCTSSYANKLETRIPKYAMNITFWAPDIERRVANGDNWMHVPEIRTLISTSTSQCIWVNGVELRKASEDGKAGLFGKIYNGDIITVFKGPGAREDNNDEGSGGAAGGPFLKFHVEICYGDSARNRPESERGFHVEKEFRNYQRMIQERESMRLSDKENTVPPKRVTRASASMR